MRRREFIKLASGVAVIGNWPARAQRLTPTLRVGVAAHSPRSIAPFAAFEKRMAELGYIEDGAYVFDYVRTEGKDQEAYEAGYREVMKRNADIFS